MRLFNRPLLWLAALVAFFVNPMFACVLGEGDFQYGAEEMRAAVEGTWDVTLTFDDGRQQALTIAVEQGEDPQGMLASSAATGRSLIRPAAACENRTLVKSAEACSSSSSMPLAVTFVGGDESFRAVPMRGQLSVFSTVFRSGVLTFRIGTMLVTGTLTPTGEATDVGIADPAPVGSAVLVRTSL